MSNECTVCYSTDLNFLLPSIVSASCIRRFVPADKADIYIYTVGVEQARAQEIGRFLASYGINIVTMDEHVFNQLDQQRLSRTYTPTAMFGRLFVDELLPSSCRRIVYVDGDTWIERDPSTLIEAVVPEGRFAAAEDTIFYRQKLPYGGTTKFIRSYFAGLGLNPQNGYFNSGVFATSRATWKTIAREAFDYYLKNTDACEHSPDQSALNAIMGDRRVRLSTRWNFQTQLKIWGADRFITPIIYHFNRSPKPWMGVCAPWQEIYSRYQEAVAPFSSLNLPLKKLPAEDIENANRSTQKSYGYLQLPFVSRAALEVIGFRSGEKNAWL